MSFTVTIDTIFCLFVAMTTTVTIGSIMVSMVNVVVAMVNVVVVAMVNVVVVAMQPGLVCCVVDKVM